MIYIYGPLSGFSSYPIVMRSMHAALEACGLECAALDISGGEFKNTHRCLPNDVTARLALGVPPDPRESNVIFAMKPEPQMKRLVTDHGMKLVGLHVGDVSEIPPEWGLILEHEAFIVVPSAWMEYVVRKAGFSKVVVSRHGVEDFYLSAPTAAPLPPGPPQFLHFCSAGVFPDRKSTPGVLRAFQRLVRSERGATLTLVVSELRKPIKRLLGALDGDARSRVFVKTKPYGFSADQLISLYSSHHALVCPSRSEGFGMQALESRALGIPVIQTFCTGMRDHLPEDEDPRKWGVIPVKHGDMVPAWGDFGLAPEVTDQAIYEGMVELLDTYDRVREVSARRADEMHVWSWKNQTHALAEKLKMEDV